MWFVSPFGIFISFDWGELGVVWNIFDKQLLEVLIKPVSGLGEVLVSRDQ